MPYDFSLSSTTLANGRIAHYAKRNNSEEAKFLIGYKTLYNGQNHGLFNIQQQGFAYSPAEYEPEFGFWAYFLAPTAKAESNNAYTCLNTYDRAKFTFGFMQYASHVPNGDFVKFFKKLLTLPNGRDYFPKLVLHNNRIHYQNQNGTLQELENDQSTERLMNYLNPTLNEVENQELICAARMVHWASNDAQHRRIQVETAISHFTEGLKSYHRRFNLDDAPAKVCLMVADIRHQGRGMNDRIAHALNTNGDYERAFSNLCTIGSVNYQPRINTVRGTINQLLTAGIFNKKYDATTNSFVNL